MKRTKHFPLYLIICSLLILLMGLVSIRIGAKEITAAEIIQAIFHYDKTSSQHVIIQSLRLPRLLISAAAGASLAVSGAIMQGITRNPMASPSIFGINAGAGLGLALTMIFLPQAGFSQTIWFSFAGAGLAFLLIYGVSSLTAVGKSPVYLALIGSAVSAMLNSVSQALATYFNIAQDITFWQAGGVAGVRPEQVRMVLPWTGLGLVIAICISRSISILSLGEDVAQGLGGKIARTKFLAGVAVLLLTGSAVAVAGPIGFVGLVVPHFVRFLIGTDYRKVIIFSAFAGAWLTITADVISRVINPPYETPIGAMTALIGVPFFIHLAMKKA